MAVPWLERLLLQHLSNLCPRTHPDTVQIDVHHFVPVCSLVVPRQGLGAADASVVDSIVDPAELSGSLGDCVIDGCLLCDVEFQRQDFNVGVPFFDFCCGFFDRGRIQISKGQCFGSISCK